jgi:hypothetical protein
METPDSDIQPASVYGKDDLFDVREGMEVTGPDGSRIGVVKEVAGFGSSQTRDSLHTGEGERVTQAFSGTGYIRVDRTSEMGSSAKDLIVPFHGVHGVTAERGLELNEAVISELQGHADNAAEPTKSVEQATTSGWRRWLPGKK